MKIKVESPKDLFRCYGYKVKEYTKELRLLYTEYYNTNPYINATIIKTNANALVKNKYLTKDILKQMKEEDNNLLNKVLTGYKPLIKKPIKYRCINA